MLGAMARRALGRLGSASAWRGAAGERSPAASMFAAGELVNAPPVALALGVAGALPFVCLTPPAVDAAPDAVVPPEAKALAGTAQRAYGAVILSFLGGLHWQAALAGGPGAAARFAWSVTPSLVAWPALMLPPEASCASLAGGLGLAWLVDRDFAARGAYPRWFAPLRTLLTTAACASLLTSAVTAKPQRGANGGGPSAA